MLIPVGFLASSGAAAGDYQLISTAYGTGSASTITFSSVPNTFKHLQVRWVANYGTGGSELLRMRFNGNATSSYVSHYLEGNGSSVGSYWTGLADYNLIAELYANGASASSFSAGIVDIYDYANSNKYKTTKTQYGKYPPIDVKLSSFRSGFWQNTAAISTIELSSAYGSTIPTTCRFSLYGIKG